MLLLNLPVVILHRISSTFFRNRISSTFRKKRTDSIYNSTKSSAKLLIFRDLRAIWLLFLSLVKDI